MKEEEEKTQPKLLALFICGSKYGIIHKITIMSLLTNIKSNFPTLVQLQINVDQIRDDHFYAFQLLVIHFTYQFMKLCCCG